MNFFEQELRRFTGKDTAFKSSKPVYVGRACFIPLIGNRRARLEFVTCGYADHYEALDVTILSASEGKVDHLRLRFGDYFTQRKGGCSGTTCPHIWINYGEAEWYVEPTSLEIKTLAKAAYDYIMLFA